MATSARFRWTRGKQSEEFGGNELRVGTKVPCELVLDDPLAASLHCTLIATGSGFLLRSADSVLGTYCNGLPVAGDQRLSHGDRLVVGVAVLTVELPADRPGTLHLQVAERSFRHFTRKERKEFQSDADEWVRSEVRFGRYPALRRANWAVGALLLLLLPWLWFSGASRVLASPGPLSAAHARLFDESLPIEVLAADFGLPAELLAQAREQRCATCHDSYRGAPTERCTVCHADLVGSGPDLSAAVARHPFRASADLDCASCHREHRGGERPVTRHSGEAVQCSACHDEMADGEAALAQAVQDFGLTDEVLSAERRASPGFEAFRHGDHHTVTDCSRCHRATSGGRTDFAVASFALCAECHGPEPSEQQHLAQWQVEIQWHGAGTGQCLQCHAEAYREDLASISGIDVPAQLLRFEVESRDHRRDLDGHSGGRDCAECHLTGTDLWAARAAEQSALRPFLHSDHLTFPNPISDEQRQVTLTECSDCHLGQAEATALASGDQPFLGPSTDTCISCHRGPQEAGGAPRNLILDVTFERNSQVPGERVPFPHDRHADVPGGCLACHQVASTDGRQLDRPFTPDEVLDCSGCHTAERDGGRVHKNLAGSVEGCNACHLPGTQGRMPAVFRGPQPEFELSSSFSHRTPGHDSADCAACHGTVAAVGDEVRLPSSGAAECRACHATHRFHWR
jgi:predicted CXXCH cytochrome family protein